jgi:uncharacterized membrane protein YhaH (DUF805 family)
VRDRSWFSPAAVIAWFLAVLVLFFGGGIGWLALGALCEDVGSAGSDEYCNHGGWETAGLVFACLLVLGILVPAAALAARRKRLFWAGVVGPVLLGVLNFLLAPTYGSA